MALSLHLGMCLLGSLFAANDKPDPSKEDLKKLQGTWTVVAAESEGKKLPREKIKDIEFDFDESKLTVSHGEEKKDTVTVTLDASKKPKWITGGAVEGIYDIKGDDLKICISKKKEGRPREFSTKADSGQGMFTLKRKK